MKYAVVIPVYNERDLFPVLLARLEATPPVADASRTPLERLIVIVDDGSSDGTRDFLETLRGRAGVEVAMHSANRGKGSAVRTGFARALELGADTVLIQDADLEYDPDDHAVVLGPILDDRADVVIGSRFSGAEHRVLYFWHSVMNRYITLLSNMLTNLNLTDIECCFKAFRRDVLERIEIEEPRFGVEPELIAKVSRLRLPRGPDAGRSPVAPRIWEVPVSYAGRTYAEGKKIGWRDGVSAVRCILKYNLLKR